jgi:hypothetical protein
MKACIEQLEVTSGCVSGLPELLPEMKTHIEDQSRSDDNSNIQNATSKSARGHCAGKIAKTKQ